MTLRFSEDDYAAYQARQKCLTTIAVKNGLPVKTEQKPDPPKGKPNKTELEYSRILQCEFPGARLCFEGFVFKMANGHKYTPDWVLCRGALIMCIEVKARGKNGFRQASYGRAKLAFDQCRVDYPAIKWRWAEKQNGSWEVRDFE